MPNKSLTYADIEAMPGGSEHAREFDLVIAANVLSSRQAKMVLFNDTLNHRVSSFCRPLDTALEPTFHGIISVKPEKERRLWEVFEELQKDLATKPRGHWAIFEQLDHFDVWISNGKGKTETLSGAKFAIDNPNHRLLTFENYHPALYRHAVYYRQDEIEREICEFSIASSGIHQGSRFKNLTLNGVTWSNLEYLGAQTNNDGKPPYYPVRCTRRGVSAREFRLSASQFMRLLDLPYFMPPEYEDPHNNQRLSSLHERRVQAAQNAWDKIRREQAEVCEASGEMDDPHFCSYASRAPFRYDGDVYSRRAYTADPQECPNAPIYRYSVTFAPDSARLLTTSIKQV